MNLTPQQITNFLLAQWAAESYLTGANSPEILARRLRLGSNNFTFTGDTDAVSNTATLPAQTRMTDTQVAEFNTRYEVRDHLPNTMTGFSATLLWDKLDNRYVLSFRSTEYADPNKGGDWVRDGLNGAGGEINNHGFAVAQIGDMEAYYRQLQASGKLPAGANYMVTGYSLGGHLATVFAQAHAGEAGFAGAVTFNTPGHGTLTTGTVRDFVNTVYTRLQAGGFLLRPGEGGDPNIPLSWYKTASYDGLDGANTSQVGGVLKTILDQYLPVSRPLSSSAQALAGNITQVYGMADTGDSLWVANSDVHSNNYFKLFIEDQPDVQGLGPLTAFDGIIGGLKSDFGTTHSITLLADTLMVMTTLQKLAPALTPEAMKVILSAGSNERGIGFLGQKGQAESNSLETVVESLAVIFGVDIAALVASKNGGRDDGKLPRDDAGGGFGNLLYRNIFHEALKEISAKAGAAGNYTIETLAGMLVPNVVTAAEGADARGMAYRYALKTGNPFALIGADYQERHNVNGELNRYDPASRTGTLTQEWIKDRADFLERLNYFNDKNARYDLTKASENPNTLGDTTATQYNEEDIVWDDRARNALIRRGEETGTTAYRMFGSDTTDVLNGSKNADRLYGSGSTDVLTGKGGADYLEGGAGLDIYEYDSARKSGLFGLTTTPDGHDTVLDVDGLGVLRYVFEEGGFAGTGLGAKSASTIIRDASIRTSGTNWQSADGKFSYQRVQNDLIVTVHGDAEGRITLKDFKEGDFGIYLLDEQRDAPQTTRDILGDKRPALFSTEVQMPIYGPSNSAGSEMISGGPGEIHGKTSRTRTRCEARTRRHRTAGFMQQARLARCRYRRIAASVQKTSIKTSSYILFRDNPMPPSATKKGGSKWAW